MMMSTLEQIEAAILTLPSDEFQSELPSSVTLNYEIF